MTVRARPRVGVLADDMTGALDSAARLAAVAGPIPLEIAVGTAGEESFAISSNTREASAEDARQKVLHLAPRLAQCSIAFKKIDSLLRGHPFVELAAVMSAAEFDACLLAPAFPEQGRLTIGGQQWLAEQDGERRRIGPNLAEAAEREGLVVTKEFAADRHGSQVVIADAVSPADLSRAVRQVRSQGIRCLYCGSAGLAGALSGLAKSGAERPDEPILAIVGSPHPVSRRQVVAVYLSALAVVGPIDAAPWARLTQIGKNHLITFSFPPAMGRIEAEGHIRHTLHFYLARAPRPESLLIVGGETLALVTELLAVEAVVVSGELLPGLSVGQVDGGPWHGLRLIAKSGAFGNDDLLLSMLSDPSWPTSARVLLV